MIRDPSRFPGGNCLRSLTPLGLQALLRVSAADICWWVVDQIFRKVRGPGQEEPRFGMIRFLHWLSHRRNGRKWVNYRGLWDTACHSLGKIALSYWVVPISNSTIVMPIC